MFNYNTPRKASSSMNRWFRDRKMGQKIARHTRSGIVFYLFCFEQQKRGKRMNRSKGNGEHIRRRWGRHLLLTFVNKVCAEAVVMRFLTCVYWCVAYWALNNLHPVLMWLPSSNTVTGAVQLAGLCLDTYWIVRTGHWETNTDQCSGCQNFAE